jgi:4-hydroxy-tetrahydrodipicolinate synthase
LVGVTDTCLSDTLSIAEIAADLGANAVVASAPCYFQIAQPELLDYFRKLIAELPLPLVLYNMPGLTKVSFEPGTVRQMLEYENVIGMKDSSGDLNVAAEYVKVVAERSDWTLMTGPEELLAEALQIGVMGGVCGGANLFPRLFVDLFEAAVRKDAEQVELHHNAVLHLGKNLYQIGHYSSAYMKGIKCALSCLGICEDHMALPLNRFAEQERLVVKQKMEQLRQLEVPGVQSVLAGYSNA